MTTSKAPGRPIPNHEVEAFVGAAAVELQKKNPRTLVDSGLGLNMLKAEQGGPDAKGVWNVVQRPADPGGKGVAQGMAQMFPQAAAEAHRLLTGVTPTADQTRELLAQMVADPGMSIRYGMAYLACVEREVMGWSVVRRLIREPAHLQAIVSAGYHMGPGALKPLVEQSCSSGAFDIVAFVAGYEAFSAKMEGGQVSGRARAAAGLPGSPATSGASAETPLQVVRTGPTDADAEQNRAIPLSFDVAGSTPITPLQLIQDGLEVASWFDGDSLLPGKLTANPHLRGVPAPAWFELRLNRTDGKSLTSPTTGRIVKVMLNVSLTSVNTRSQHLVNREPTATGIMVSFWGSQPDIITGRGTTGAFINQTGLTALMSNRLTPAASGWWDLIQQAYGKREMPSWEQTSTGMNKAAMNIMWGLNGKGVNRFRVAAQDAFAEMLALFKNNGVIRFLPLSWMEAQKNKSTLIDAQKNRDSWSPAAGATGFQMLARAGDVHARGYVVFKYKGATYLGYFKSFNFTADAKSPFKWDFDFTFRVLKSLTPFYHYSTK